MSEFDVFVHSSLAESFGMVFIEAFALGIPIVSTPVGVAPEIIRDGVTGFLSNGTDRSSIKATLRKMLEVQEDWKKMGRRGSEIANRFDVRLTQAECDKLYIEWLKQT
jgi:glycosyltransferase involved in cell wall biosynthesis